MLRDVNHIRGFRIHATDGDIGHVREFYFDDREWMIRYLVADTGKWLPGRQVLISPAALIKLDWTEKRIYVDLTTEQVKSSPEIGQHLPVTRKHEFALHKHYGWEIYWTGNSELHLEADVQPDSVSDDDAVHLQSTDFLRGFFVHAVDGEFGSLENFLIDDDSWTIRYFVIGTQHYVVGKTVLICPDWIKRFNAASRTISVNLTREQIKTSPEYDPFSPISRQYEEELFAHYSCKGYWV
jgi:hypothetical protein